MSTAPDILFTPFQLRGMTLRNRLVWTAHSTGLSDAGLVGDRLMAYYEARARGGVGLIIVGTSHVHPTSVSKLQTALLNWDTSVIPGFRALTERVHAHDTRLFLQLNHAGGLSGSPGGVSAISAPSEIRSELGVEIPHELTVHEIRSLVAAYADAATRARDGGFDGIEVHAGHGNLIQQFLSPLTNQRDDAYGGDLESRARFGREVVSAVRGAVGSDVVVGIRLTIEEDLPGGLVVGDAVSVLPSLIEQGDLDYVSATSGSDTSSLSLPRHYAPMYIPTLHMRHLARAVKSAVTVPVLAAGRITDPLDAADILRSGDADLVGMTRALIADSDFANKAYEGRLDEILYCVGINDGCLGRLFQGLSVTCVQDPTSGREIELGPLTPAAASRRVVVVGAGPAGLEAARAAAVRGHDVTLIEKDAEPGGQIRIARRAPGRAEVGAIADQLTRALLRTDADLVLSTVATVDSLLALDPEVVVIATGSEAAVAEFDDGEGRVIPARHAYDSGALIGSPLVVFDTHGEAEGVTTADWLASRGYDVTLVTSGATLGWRLDPMTRRMLQERLVDQGVQVLTSTVVNTLTDVGIRVSDVINQREYDLEGIATVVTAGGRTARNGLHHQLRAAAPDLEVLLVGDAYAPRRIEAAIHDGHMAGRRI